MSELDFQKCVPLFPVLPHIPSLLVPSRDDNPNTTESRDNRTVWSFRHTKSAHRLWAQRHRWDPQYRCCLYSPARRTSFCWEYNSGEDATSAIQVFGSGWETKHRLASLLLQKREATSARIHHFTGKVLCHAHHTFQARVNLWRYNHSKRKSSRDIKRRTRKHLTQKKSKWTMIFPEIPSRISSPRRTWSLTMTLVCGISYLSTSWGAKESDTLTWKVWDTYAWVEGGTCSKCHPWMRQTTFVLNTLKFSIEIRNLKLHEENKPRSMPNCKNVRKFIEMLALKLLKKSRN